MEKEDKKTTFTGTLLQFNVVNGNGRMYKPEAFTSGEDGKTVLAELNHKAIDGRLLGEFEPDYSGENLGEVRLNNVSHRLDNVRINDDKLVADITILDTPNGELLRKNIDKYVFRPRGEGTVREDKTVDLKRIITFDAVSKENDAFNIE